MVATPHGQPKFACPRCGGPGSPQGCDHCGRGPEPLLQALAEIDEQLVVRGNEFERLRVQLDTVSRQVDSLRRRRSSVAGELHAKRQAAMAEQWARQAAAEAAIPSGVAEARPPADSAATAGLAAAAPTAPGMTVPGPGPDRRPGPRPSAVPRPDSRTPEASTRSVQNVLLSLGGILSAAAIIVFTAVAWATFGAWGRAGILTAITIGLMIAPLWIVKRGLHATAETVSGLAILMLPCDAIALYLLRLFPTAATEPITAEPATRDFGAAITTALTTGVHTPGIATGLLLITGVAVGYRMLTRMIVPGFAVAALGMLTLVIATVQADPALGAGVLVCAAAIQALAARLFDRRPARRGRTAGKVLVHSCGALAVVQLLTAVGAGTARSVPAYTLLALAAAAAVLLAVAQRLPDRWRGGPMWTTRIALAGAGTVAVGLGLAVVGRWLLLPLPPWRAGTAVPAWPLDERHPFGWRLTATVVILTVVAAALLPERDKPGRPATDTGAPQWQQRRLVLGLAGGVLALLTVPPALGLSWRASALLLTAAALAVVAGSVAVKDRRLSTPLLISAIPLGFNAVVLSAGGPATTLTVLLALFGCLAALAGIAAWRGLAAQSGALTGVALWTLCGAVPVALHLLDLAPSHVAALSSILAAATALATGYLLTRETTPAGRRFTSWTLFGLLGGIATASITAAAVALALPGPLFVVLSAVGALPLYLGVAVVLESTVRFTDPDGSPAPQPSRARRLATGMATIALLGALGGYVSMWTPGDTLPAYVILGLIAASIAKLLPRELGEGPGWGAWTVTGLAAGVAAAVAVSAIPALFGVTAPMLLLDTRTPVLLWVVAAAALVLLPSGWRVPVTATTASLGALCVPVAWPVPWWTGGVLFVAIAVGYGLWAVFAPDRLRRETAAAEGTTPDHEHQSGAVRRIDHTGLWVRGLVALGFAGYGLAAAALHPQAPDRPAGCGLAAALAAVLVLACAAIAVLSYRHRRPLGGVAVATALVLLPGSVVLAGLSLRLAAEPIQLGAMAAACLGLLVAAALRINAPGYLAWATLVVPPVAVACARAGLPSQQSGMYIAVAGLIGVGAAMLMLPNRRAAVIRTALSGVAIVTTMAQVLPLSIATLTQPYRWVTAVWTETPPTTLEGLTPTIAPAHLIDATGWDLAILAVCVTTIALAILGLTGRGWGIGATFVAVAIALPTVPVVFDLPWPSLPFTALAIAVAAYVLSTHVRLAPSQLSILGVVALVCCGTGLTGSLASRGATLTALTVLGIGTLAGGLLGASPARRATGWLLSSATVTGLVTATAFAANLPPERLPYGIVAVAALFLALASARTPLTGPATWAAEAAGHLVAITAITAAASLSATTAATVSTPAIVLVIYGALLGLLAVRAAPDEDTDRLLASKRWYTAGSITAAFAAYWLLLADAKVSVIEVYTVPFALATLLAGWLELRRRPTLRSWTAYGPGLCLLLLPPLAQILLTEDEPLRRLGLGVASIAILLMGTRQRFQAPVVVATIMLVVQTGYEITLLWTLVPSWLPLAIAGVLLLTLGATFEKRRRDLRRLRGAIADMR